MWTLLRRMDGSNHSDLVPHLTLGTDPGTVSGLSVNERRGESTHLSSSSLVIWGQETGLGTSRPERGHRRTTLVTLTYNNRKILYTKRLTVVGRPVTPTFPFCQSKPGHPLRKVLCTLTDVQVD